MQRHDISSVREIELRLDRRSASGKWFASDFTPASVQRMNFILGPSNEECI